MFLLNDGVFHAAGNTVYNYPVDTNSLWDSFLLNGNRLLVCATAAKERGIISQLGESLQLVHQDVEISGQIELVELEKKALKTIVLW